jgi:hypothetical protein
MIWEYLRSCYSFSMRVYVGGVPTIVPARWYWTKPGAKQFPGPHGCAASVWLDNDTTNLDWGEVTPWPKDRDSDVRRGLDTGANPGYPGQCLVGDPQWFLDGRLPAGIMDDPVPTVPQCCLPVTVSSSGGLVLGGTGQFMAPMGPCVGCINGLRPAVFRIIAVGGTGDFSGMNGTFSLSPNPAGSCSYQGAAGTVLTSIDVGHVLSTINFFDTGTGGGCFYSMNLPWDCMHQTGGWAGGISSGTGTIPTITVGP